MVSKTGFVSHNKVHKTVETKLKPVSVSLNRMRPKRIGVTSLTFQGHVTSSVT